MTNLSPILHIIRGVSGSGKTTLAKNLSLAVGCYYFEADMYFVRVDGKYTFNPAELPKAHEWCLEQVRKEMDLGYSVIVSNTFTREWEMQEYIRAALLHDYRVHIITCTGQYQNTHGLTKEQVARQVARFESNAEIKAANSRYDNPNITFAEYNEYVI
jgi:predicted kinase